MIHDADQQPANRDRVSFTQPDSLDYRVAVADMCEFLDVARKLVVLTGAGISTESGIPDFRGPQGVWSRVQATSHRAFLNDPEARERYWQIRNQMRPLVAAARPNDAHRALVALHARGTLAGVITQNFDGLHQEAGLPAEAVIELHGTNRQAECQTCGRRYDIDEMQARVDAGERDPRCSDCGGLLKAATILFGQRIPQRVLDAAFGLVRECDALLVVGSSLRVVPAARIPLVALQRHVPLLILNLEPTPLDARADVVLHAAAAIALPEMVAGLGAR